MKQVYWGQRQIKPADAAKILEEQNTFAGQRQLKRARVEMLKRKLEQGLFRGAEIAFGKMNGARILLNGQHQLTAIAEGTKAVKAMVQEFQCDSESDLARCYSQFDIVPRRTEREIVQAFATGTGDDIPVDQLQMALRGLTFLIHTLPPGGLGTNLEQYRVTTGMTLLPDERAELLNQFRGEAMFVINTIYPEDGRSLAETKFLARGGSVGAMIMTFRKHKSDAKAFWSMVRDGEQLNRNDPSKRLREALMGMRGKAGGGQVSREMYAKCVQAWNAWRENRELQVLKGTSRMTEVR